MAFLILRCVISSMMLPPQHLESYKSVAGLSFIRISSTEYLGYLDEYFMPHRRYESNEMKKERQFKSCNLILFNNFKERLGIIHKS